MLNEDAIKRLDKIVEGNFFEPEVYKNLYMEEAYYIYKHTLGKKGNVMATKANFFFGIVMKRLQSLSAFYVLYYGTHNVPYVYCDQETFDDCVYLYTDEEEAKQSIGEHENKGLKLRPVKVENAQFLQFFAELFYLGANMVVIDRGIREVALELDKICKKPDWKKMKGQVAGVTNPELSLTMCYYVRELQNAQEERSVERMQELEEEMTSNLVKGRYLIPVVPNEDGGKEIRIAYLKTNTEEIYLPVFTDAVEFNKYNQERKFNVLTVEAKGIMDFLQEKIDGITLNPFGANLQMKSPMVRQLF